MPGGNPRATQQQVHLRRFEGRMNEMNRALELAATVVETLRSELNSSNALLERHVRYTVEDRDDLLDETKAHLAKYPEPRIWDAINQRWANVTETVGRKWPEPRLTRQDTFAHMRREDAERAALQAGKDWLARWNVLGPDVDSVHRELFDALTALRKLEGK